MRLRRLLAASVLAVGSALVSAAPAHAVTDTLTIGNDKYVLFDDQVNASAQTQRFSATVTIVDGAIGYVSYHEVATHHPDLHSECGATLAQDKGRLLINHASRSTGPVSAAVTVELGTYVFCTYHDDEGAGTAEAAVIMGLSTSGTYIPGVHPGTGKICAVNVYASVLTKSKSLYYVYGATNGPRTGVVRIQRKTAAGWRTIASVHLVKAQYMAHLVVHRGDRLRAYYGGDSVWRPDVSPVIIVR